MFEQNVKEPTGFPPPQAYSPAANSTLPPHVFIPLPELIQQLLLIKLSADSPLLYLRRI